MRKGYRRRKDHKQRGTDLAVIRTERHRARVELLQVICAGLKLNEVRVRFNHYTITIISVLVPICLPSSAIPTISKGAATEDVTMSMSVCSTRTFDRVE